MKYIKKCLCCEKEFVTNLSTQKYCCGRCQDRDYRRKKQNIRNAMCSYCGNTFITASGVKKFCSPQCRKKYYDEFYIRPEDFAEKQCVVCGLSFVPKSSRHICCSSECQKTHAKDLRDQKAEELIARRNTEQPELPLQIKDHFIVNDILDASKIMRSKYGNKIINSWLLGGFTKSLKEAIKERDGWKCYICGNDTNLHVHHIIPRIEGGPHIPENLITLCGSCHKTIENGDTKQAVKICVRNALKQSIS